MEQQRYPGSTGRLLSAAIILLQLFCVQLWGLDPLKSVDQYKVDDWKRMDGLPSDTVLFLTQTPDGYLWIGASKGLVRFDGVKFTVVHFAEKEEIYSQEVRHLLVDRRGALWIGSSTRLILHRGPGSGFKLFTAADGITGEGVRRITEDMNGNTWISFTSGYVNRYADGRFTAFDASHGLTGKKVNAIIENRRGDLLFVTRENGIFKYNDGSFSKYPLPGLDNVFIQAIHEEQNGDLWVGANKGLFRFTGLTNTTGIKSERFTTGDGLTNNYILCICEDSDGNLWVGTIKGLNRVKKNQDGAVGFENLLETFSINYLFEDREKSLWAATDTAGLKRLKNSKFRPYVPLETRPDEIPNSLFQDRHGDTWVGTISGKLFRCRAGEIVETVEAPELSGTGIAAIAEDAEGNLWLGTSGKGVFQKKKDRLIRLTTGEGLADNLVTAIYRDSRDNLWFSTFDGVSVRRFSTGVVETLNSRNGLIGKRVHNVREDETNNIWIAGDRGLTVLKDGKTAEQDINHYLTETSVTCIYPDSFASDEAGGVYWVATDGAGLIRLALEDGTVVSRTAYTTAHGMTTNFIYQFREDAAGNFWLMSNSGILRVAKSELNRMAEGKTGTVNCTSFGTSDGMKSLEFDNKFSPHSVLKTVGGEFRFITKKGVTVVSPGKIHINKTPPAVVIEAVYFNRRAVPFPPAVSGPVTFKGAADVDFHFTAPTFLSPEKIRFKYRLEGVDEDWVVQIPDRGRVAEYKKIPPGTYTFRVTACNADGVWNQTGVGVSFTVKPFFYQTILFKTAVGLLFAALAAFLFQVYQRRKGPLEKKLKYQSSPLNSRFAAECITRLKGLMDVERVYCDADLSLQTLAEKMAVAPHQLSQLLNEKLDRNFAEYINGYRIEEVKRILKTPAGARRKISTIAGDVGFNTMAAFYKAFKKHTGMTPTEYKETIRH